MNNTKKDMNPTLFARYKRMINLMWADGHRKYTASELNRFVGFYERSTRWKSSNNNPYYSTRLYQSALKHAGCISKIKRGLWQINGPVPEWFCSYHLASQSTRRQLERSSFVWQKMPAEHKVNPWRDLKGSAESTCASTQCEHEVAIEHTQPVHLTKLPGLNVTCKVITGIPQHSDGGMYHYKVTERAYTLNDRPISEYVVSEYVACHGENIADLLAIVDKHCGEYAINERKREQLNAELDRVKAENNTPAAPKTYTIEEVKEMLYEWISITALEEIGSAVEDGISNVDSDDVVDISFDRYDRRLTVKLNIDADSILSSTDIAEDLKDSLDNYLDTKHENNCAIVQ